MQIVGQFDTQGGYFSFTEPREVVKFGDTLRSEDGFVEAVKDEYGDWVSPSMLKLGMKSKIKLKETNND